MESISTEQFIPEYILSGKKKKQYLLQLAEKSSSYHLHYKRSISNQFGSNVGWRVHKGLDGSNSEIGRFLWCLIGPQTYKS